MAGVIFATVISIGLPLIGFVYSCYKQRYIPFLLGVLAFVVSQVLLRIPIMQYLAEHSTSYLMFSATKPFLFAVVTGLTAGLFEECARYVAMRFFMTQRDWKSGFLFGVGHGGIEAVIFVGIGAVTLFFSTTAIAYNEAYFIGGVERFFALLLHIGFSIIVLQGVVKKNVLYLILAIMLHGFVDALVGILPLYVPKESQLLVIECLVAIMGLAIFSYSIWIKRKGVLQ